MSEIRDYVLQHELFNHHDHQQGFGATEAERNTWDFRSLLGYADADLNCAAGRDVSVAELSVDELAALWRAIRLTGYGRAVDLGCRALFGMAYTPDNWPAITAALQARLAGRSGAEIYADMLSAAQVRWTINDCFWVPVRDWAATLAEYPDSYRFTFRRDELFSLVDLAPADELGQLCDRNVYSVSALVEVLNGTISQYLASGRLAAIKIGMAYQRDLTITDPTLHEAELAFNRLRNLDAFGDGRQQRSGAVSAAEGRALGDYLLQRLLERAADEHLPVQIHTGYLAGNWGALEATPTCALTCSTPRGPGAPSSAPSARTIRTSGSTCAGPGR